MRRGSTLRAMRKTLLALAVAVPAAAALAAWWWLPSREELAARLAQEAEAALGVGVRIDQAYIGSCANGTIDDLELAAEVVRGKRVASGVRFIVTPASQRVYREALKSGALEKLADAGAMIAPPTCGACGGGHMGVIGPDETCITATTRNFKGRMGDPSSKVFMGSPATVAASALTGYITDPREFLN